MKTKLTQERLHSLLRYYKTSGRFVWLVRPSRHVYPGDTAGSPHSGGYVIIKVDGQGYLAHRLAWFYMLGHWPTPDTDHKNRIRTDNRWKNLREGTRSFNLQNQGKPKSHNRLGVLGVIKTDEKWRKSKYKAVIGLNGKNIYLGRFLTPELAHAAYVKAKRKLHAGCTI